MLRGDLLAHLLDWQRRQGQRQAEALEAVGAQCAAGLAAKQRELDAAAAQLARQREVLKRTGDARFKAARWRRHLTLGCIAWRAWREQARRWVASALEACCFCQTPASRVDDSAPNPKCRQRRKQASLAAAARHYDDGKLRRGVLRAWRELAAGQLPARVSGCGGARCASVDGRDSSLAGCMG